MFGMPSAAPFGSKGTDMISGTRVVGGLAACTLAVIAGAAAVPTEDPPGGGGSGPGFIFARTFEQGTITHVGPQKIDGLRSAIGACGGNGLIPPPGPPGPPQRGGSHPVDYATGHKLESALDLVIPVAGTSFRLVREYTSDPAYSNGQGVGNNWALGVVRSLFVAFTEDSEDIGDAVMTTRGLPGGGAASTWTDNFDNSFVEEGSLPTNPNRLEGSSGQEVWRTAVTVGEGEDEGIWPVWALRSPGEGTTYFIRKLDEAADPEGAEEPVDALVGSIILSADVYGNRQEYEHGEVTVGESELMSLKHVRCYDSDHNLQADIEFTWSETTGRLLEVAAFRPYLGEGGGSIVTHRVLYTYHDGSGEAWLGTGGDLIQVRVDERVDPAPDGNPTEAVWRQRVTQYRYHAGGAEVADADGDGYPEETGSAQQLKLVINPEQVEFYAQLRAADAATLSEVADFADDLMALEDGEMDPYALDLKPVDFASKVVSNYHLETFQVLTQYVKSSGCGCSASGRGTQESYRYFDYEDGSVAKKTTWVTESYKEGNNWVPNLTRIVDMERAGDYEDDGARDWVVVNLGVVEGELDEGVDESSRKIWITHYKYSDDALCTLDRVFMPSATSSYAPYRVVDTVPTPPSYSARSDAGLAWAYEYNDRGRRTAVRLRKGVPGVDAVGSYQLVSATEYSSTPGEEHLPAATMRIRTDGEFVLGEIADDDLEVTLFEYEFHDSTDHAVLWIKTTIEAETTGENGPYLEDVEEQPIQASYSSWEVFDARGFNTWSIAADGAYTKRVHDNDESYPASVSRTGQVVKTIRNADADVDDFPDLGELLESLPTDRNADGGSLTTLVTRDLLGRVQAVTSPGGASSVTTREMQACPERPYLLYYAETAFPHSWEVEVAEEEFEPRFAGAATVSWIDAGGRGFASRQITLDEAYSVATQTNQYRQVYSDYALGALVSRSYTELHVTGAVKEARQWHDASDSEGYYVTRFDYDGLGRVSVVTGPMDPPVPAVPDPPSPEILGPGTMTRTEYDFMGRAKTTSVSSTAAGAEWAAVETRFYDSAPGEVEVEGVGDGNLTLVVQHANAGSDRSTRMHYDFRSRRVATENAVAPHFVVAYDNLGRTVESAAISAALSEHAFDLTDDYAGRASYARTSYSQRGLVYRQETATEPAEDDGTRVYLASDSWFDAMGRSVGVRSPSSPGTKATFDGLGRAKAGYTTDNGGFGNYEAVFDGTSQVSVLSGDKVVEQSEFRYVTAANSAKGQMDLVTVRRRAHETTAAGALSEGSGAVSTFTGYFYDEAGRPSRTVEYGTTTELFSAVSVTEPDPNPASPPSTGTTSVIVGMTGYDARGLVESSTDNGGTVTRFLYDSLGRRYATIENYVDATVAWGTAPDGDRWIASGVGTTDGTDRVTSTVYDAAGHVVKYIAHQHDGAEDPGTFDQVTTYTYGVEAGEGEDDSALWSHDLLRSVTYPDEGTVAYAYNRLGDLTYMTDQNGTEHSYVRDLLGRVELDCIEAFGADVDQAIACIQRGYDDAGLLVRVTSLDEEDDPVNEVRFGYTPLQEVEKVWQDHNGEVEIDSGAPINDTRLVKYVFGTEGSAQGNFTRLVAMDYPRNVNSGGAVTATLEYFYDSALNDAISRVDRLKLDGSMDVVKYDYIGVGVFAQVDYPGPGGETDVQLDRTADRNGERRTQGYSTGDVGAYPCLDGFGRVISQDWVDGALTTHASSGILPNRTQIVALGYGYDASGNRSRAVDMRPGSQWKHSFEYSYDGLDRLTQASRGNWTGSALASVAGSQQWTLDLLGNWAQWKNDTTYNGSYADYETQNRTHNEVNELTVSQVPTFPAKDEDFTYDANGNMRTRVNDVLGAFNNDFRYTYDAWNRLVRVEGGEEWSLLKMEQQFNGLNWRTWKHSDTPPPAYYDDFDAYIQEEGDGELDEWHIYTYNASWQLVDERIDASNEDIDDRRVQHVWGIRYIDDPVLHRRDVDNDGDFTEYGDGDGVYYHLTDAMFSTIALIDLSANLVERVTYDPYGLPLHHPSADLNGDGYITSVGNTLAGNDAKAITNTNLTYGPRYWGAEIGGAYTYSGVGDIDRDGDIDATDLGVWGATVATQFPGWLSAVDGVAGFDGYIYDPEVAMYMVRYRTYEPSLGRWLERDPIGHAGGRNLYEYLGSSPNTYSDPTGLVACNQDGAPPCMPRQPNFGAWPDWEGAKKKTKTIECERASDAGSPCKRVCADAQKPGYTTFGIVLWSKSTGLPISCCICDEHIESSIPYHLGGNDSTFAGRNKAKELIIACVTVHEEEHVRQCGIEGSKDCRECLAYRLEVACLADSKLKCGGSEVCHLIMQDRLNEAMTLMREYCSACLQNPKWPCECGRSTGTN